MRVSLLYRFFLALVLISCEKQSNITLIKDSVNSSAVVSSTKPKDSVQTKAPSVSALTPEQQDDSVEHSLKKIFGYRFVITGDFNGDGKQDTIAEHYYSRRDKSETNKFYVIDDTSANPYDYLVEFATRKKPISYLSSIDTAIKKFVVASPENGQLFGLSLLRNEGDLDGDGADEISYVIDWADWSSCNTCFVASYKNSKWENIYSFEIRDWQLPPLPEVYKDIGLFGVQGAYMNPGKNSTNEQLEKQVKAFPGFIKKVRDGIIRVKTFNQEVDEITKTVTLPKRHS